MQILSVENSYMRVFIQYSLPFLVIGIISRTFPLTGALYYIVPIILIINILLKIFTIPLIGKMISYFLIILAFPVYCLISSIWSLNPIISLQRSLYLLLMYTGILSSVLLYKKSFPDKGIEFLIPANILVIVLSAISLIFSIPTDRWTGGNGLGFMGFAGHQNILAAALLFTLPGIGAWGIEQSAKGPYKSGFPLRSNIEQSATSNGFRLSSYFSRLSFFILLLTANCLLITLTYSRAAILAFGVGIITYLLLTKSKKILLLLFSITALLLVFYFTVPFIQNSIVKVLNKDGVNVLGRRTVLWEPSFEAAKMGSIFGLGYGVSAPDIKTPIKTGSHYEDGRYVREKGNSVLAMIEETGFIGLFVFLLPVLFTIIKLFNNKFSLLTTHYSLLTSALAAMLVHSQFEAWWVGVGSITLPLFLIFLFMALPSTYYFNNKSETE
jgi:O-antigen ligase